MLEQTTFDQKRQLIEWLIDRVIVSDNDVEIRYVVPTHPEGPRIPFCQLRSDYRVKGRRAEMTERRQVSSGLRWEKEVGYSRAVRIGGIIEVAGTTAVDELGQVVSPGSPYEQTRFILKKIERALIALGASMNDVVRTRMYVTDIQDWEEVGRAHGEFFRDIRPAATMVEVKALIQPELLVEIEVSAVIPD